MLSSKETKKMQIPLSDAIRQLRDELREAILEGKDQDIIFTPNGIDIELGVTFSAEAKASGGFKLLAFLDLSAEAKAGRESQHKIKLSLSVADKDGQPLKVRSDTLPEDLP
jgi:hypothetical protein